MSADTSSSSSKKPQTRRHAEFNLLKALSQVVSRHGKSLRQQQAESNQQQKDRGSSSHHQAYGLTKAERPILNKKSYYGWTQGAMAGVATFVVLYGGFRYRRTRSAKLPVLQAPRKSYQQLDNVSTNSSSASSSPNQSSSSDAFSDLPYIGIGAACFFTTYFVARFKTDRTEFYKRLATVPLKPGKSYLCHTMCPDLIQKRNELLSLQKNHPESLLLVGDFSPSDLLEDPETPELESMMHLIQNCQQRMVMQQALRAQGRAEDDEDGIVTIPEPGVPVNYLGLNVRPEFDP